MAKIQRTSGTWQDKVGDEIQRSDVPEEIRCKICERRYEEPKLLPCLHTFCKECLVESVEKRGGKLYCPICQSKVKSTEFTSVDKLPGNLMVSNLLQAIDLKRGSVTRRCESCDEEGAYATSRCYECGDFLCGNCVEAHKRVRFTKHHRIVAIANLHADAMVKTPTCAIHTHEALKMYCKQCKQPVCRTCITRDHHDHMLIALNEALDEAKLKMNALLIATRAKVPVLQRQLKRVYASKEKLESKIDDVIKGIQATSARILMAVKRREKDLYKMLRKIHDQKSDALESREIALESDLAQVLDGCDFADALGKTGDEGMVLHVSEITCARLRDLSGKESQAELTIADNEIEYVVHEKPILDELKIYGEVLTKEMKAAKEAKKEKANVERKRQEEKKADIMKSTKVNEEKPFVERRTSWLQSLANPRELIRRLSLGGNDADEKKQDARSNSVNHVETSDVGKTTTSPKLQKQQQEKSPTQTPEHARHASDINHGEDSTTRVQEIDHIYAVPDKPAKNQEKNRNINEYNEPEPPPLPPSSIHDQKKRLSNETSTLSSNNHGDPSESTSRATESPKSHSILKQRSPNERSEPEEVLESPLAWTIRAGTIPSGAHSQSYLPGLSVLTKNRRGRPREVEIQLESPDNSIVSAQIMDHKNGTYTIFYCPLTGGEHNLYVNLGGKNIRHGKKVLNFYGKFSGMGAEELFLTRRVLSCIRWQVTPGFVELKDRKLTANPYL